EGSDERSHFHSAAERDGSIRRRAAQGSRQNPYGPGLDSAAGTYRGRLLRSDNASEPVSNLECAGATFAGGTTLRPRRHGKYRKSNSQVGPGTHSEQRREAHPRADSPAYRCAAESTG